MKKFLVLFTCAENSLNHHNWMKLNQEAKKERLDKGFAATETWMNQYGESIKLKGSSLSNKTITVNSEGVHESPSKLGKFIVVEASSHEKAAKMFLDHPHFKHFPGDGVDILELIEDRQ